ncbi:Replicative DNA helicase (plasmid) [Vibrio sp. THAF191c]|nr:Replicative DNA helicase [Vibrio sp. THAF64]QGM37799.1 Replicative DNA helicase [Vibrio sp. THAF191d]QGN73142.1 Replicative DNA helicase [Vibrio sp. THAF191c]
MYRQPDVTKTSSRVMTQHSIDAMKTPPHSIEAEQSVIGGLFIDNSRWEAVVERLSAKDFYARQHRLIFQAISSLMDTSTPVDLITVSEKLEQQHELADIGGLAYLADLMKNTPSAANIMAYVDIVVERALLRHLVKTANDIADSAYDAQGRSPEELIEEAEQRVFSISEKRLNTDTVLDAKRLALETSLRLRSGAGQAITGVKTGFDALDTMTLGLQRSDFIVIAARPSHGKTTLALNVCESVSMEADKPALVFSLEMPRNQLMDKLVASLAHVNLTDLKTGNLTQEQWQAVDSSLEMLQWKNNLLIDDSAGLTPTELRAKARRLAREHGGLSLIVVDYLQLMRIPELANNRTLEIAEISRALKALAKELNVPVVALSQLNRALEQRPDKRPINSDLRDSGAIEQDADLIMFIYRDELYDTNSKQKGIAEIIIGKQRNGPVGAVRLAFQGEMSRFSSLPSPPK